MITKKSRTLAQKLFRISLDEKGCVSDERVKAVLLCAERGEIKDPANVLRVYRDLIAAQLARNTADIEHAGAVDAETVKAIEAELTAHYSRPVTAACREREDLLAGLRVRVGDDVFDTSIKGRLEALARSGF